MAEMKPGCVETLRTIEAYLDDELDSTIRVKVQTHLADCPPCMDRAEFRRHLKIMVSTKCTSDEVPPELRAKIMRLLRDELPAG